MLNELSPLRQKRMKETTKERKNTVLGEQMSMILSHTVNKVRVRSSNRVLSPFQHLQSRHDETSDGQSASSNGVKHRRSWLWWNMARRGRYTKICTKLKCKEMEWFFLHTFHAVKFHMIKIDTVVWNFVFWFKTLCVAHKLRMFEEVIEENKLRHYRLLYKYILWATKPRWMMLDIHEAGRKG